MDVLEPVTLVFTLGLALSLVVERLLEVVKVFVNLFDARRNAHTRWTRRARKVHDYLQNRLQVFEHLDPKAMVRLLDRFGEMLEGEGRSHNPGSIPVISADLVRAAYLRLWLKMLGVAVGLGLAFGLGLDFIAVSRPEEAAATFAGMAVTGIGIGLGSGIVHKMITSLEDRRARAQEKSNG